MKYPDYAQHGLARQRGHRGPGLTRDKLSLLNAQLRVRESLRKYWHDPEDPAYQAAEAKRARRRARNLRWKRAVQ